MVKAWSCTCLLPGCPLLTFPLLRSASDQAMAPSLFRCLAGDFQKPELLQEKWMRLPLLGQPDWTLLGGQREQRSGPPCPKVPLD